MCIYYTTSGSYFCFIYLILEKDNNICVYLEFYRTLYYTLSPWRLWNMMMTMMMTPFCKWDKEVIEKKKWFALHPPNSKCQRQDSIQSRLQPCARLQREIFFLLCVVFSFRCILVWSFSPIPQLLSPHKKYYWDFQVEFQ